MLALVVQAETGIAETTPTPPAELAPIEVSAPRLKRDWLTLPAPLTVISGEDVQQGQQKLQLDEALSRVPGVFARNRGNFAQDLRVSIRGFGARSPWGIRGIHVLVDGIPATLTDGQSQVDAIDLGTIQRIEVLRGPFSALYGNATGGVIDITTERPDPAGNGALEASAGADGYSRLSATAGRQYEDWGYIATATDLQLDGYRQHGSVHKHLLTAKANRKLGDTGKLRIITRLLDAPDTEDPGAVTLQQARNHPSSARLANLQYDSRQSAAEQTLGLVYTDQFSPRQDYQARLFYTHRNFIQYLPYESGGTVGYHRDYYGGGLQTTRHGQWFATDLRWTAGIDFSQQNDDRQRHDNLLGEKGPLVFSEDQTASNIGAYLQTVWSPTARLAITTGLRHDWLKFDIDDRYITAADPDDSGNRRYTEFSGNLGISYAWRTGQQVYANVSTAFESPTFAEFANPTGQGGFNPRLDPQKAINHEIGAKGLVGHRLRYQVSVFQADVKDELVVYQNADGRDYYENSGKSRRHGVEIGVTYYPTDTFTLTGSYTWAEYRFRQFIDHDGNDFAGNRLPGLPQQSFFGELAWQRQGTGFAAINVLWIGDRYADNANQVRVPDYTVVNARLGKDFRLGKQVLTLYTGLNNLFDESYFGNIRLNAYGGLYYEPAPGRTLYAGLKLAL